MKSHTQPEGLKNKFNANILLQNIKFTKLSYN